MKEESDVACLTEKGREFRMTGPRDILLAFAANVFVSVDKKKKSEVWPENILPTNVFASVDKTLFRKFGLMYFPRLLQTYMPALIKRCFRGVTR